MVGAIQSAADQGTQYYTDPASQSKSKLGRDDFLKIFLTQLQYQDPLNPMEGTEFTAQLAQFSSLEQLFNVNENLGNIRSIQDGEARFQALGFMGKEITAQGDSLYIEQGGNATGAFNLETGADCTAIIEDGAGNLVRKIPLGQQNPGTHVFTWDGRDESGNEVSSGDYRFSVLATDGSGQTVGVDTLIKGIVTKVSIEGDSPVLYVGDIPIDLSQVTEVRVAQDGQGNS